MAEVCGFCGDAGAIKVNDGPHKLKQCGVCKNVVGLDGRDFATDGMPDGDPCEHLHLDLSKGRLQWRWQFKPSHLMVAVFVFGFFYPMLYWMTVLGLGELAQLRLRVFLSFEFFWFLVSLVVGYFLVSNMVNKTTITARNNRLTVTHGPLPAPGSVHMPLHDITGVYLRAILFADTNWGGKLYTLHVKTNDKRRRLITFTADVESAVAFYGALQQLVRHGQKPAEEPPADAQEA